MEKLLHNVSDLPAAARSAVEGLVGHQLRNDQQLFIVALEAVSEPPLQQRREAWNDLQKIVNEMHANVRDAGIDTTYVERTIDEACDEVRYGR